MKPFVPHELPDLINIAEGKKSTMILSKAEYKQTILRKAKCNILYAKFAAIGTLYAKSVRKGNVQ